MRMFAFDLTDALSGAHLRKRTTHVRRSGKNVLNPIELLQNGEIYAAEGRYDGKNGLIGYIVTDEHWHASGERMQLHERANRLALAHPRPFDLDHRLAGQQLGVFIWKPCKRLS